MNTNIWGDFRICISVPLKTSLVNVKNLQVPVDLLLFTFTKEIFKENIAYHEVSVSTILLCV